jgi:hypothetical protein
MAWTCLLPSVGWEKMPEGRMRADRNAGGGSSRFSMLGWKHDQT